MTIRMFEVGGCIRDELLGRSSKDVDFAVEAPSFEAMEDHIRAEGMKIWLSRPEFLTIRAGVPKSHKLRERCKGSGVDFVLCRKDGPTLDGRRPQFVEPGTIFDDLRRRDFTVNAMARCAETGEIIDPHGGKEDLEARLLRFVGDGAERINEDGLRVLRGLRFSVTKGLTIHAPELFDDQEMTDKLRSVSTERIKDELNKMFAFSTPMTLEILQRFARVAEAAFDRPDFSLMATMRKR